MKDLIKHKEKEVMLGLSRKFNFCPILDKMG